MIRKVRNVFVSVVVFCCVMWIASPSVSFASSDSYPSKPIRWIVMWQAGGGGDTASRTYVKYLEQVLGQKIIVENIKVDPVVKTKNHWIFNSCEK